jgi:branched-chain amino acid aminotransferase
MLTGSILPGITRDSVLKLAKNWGMKCTERRISIDEVMDASQSGKLQEIFGSGTAAVISPVGELKYDNNLLNIGNGSAGPIANKMFNAITDIQYGKTAETMGWTMIV